MRWVLNVAKAFSWLLLYKILSTGTQLYINALVTMNGSSSTPWMELTTIAHMGAASAALRGIDALIDPAFQKLNPFRLTDQDRKVIAVETTTEK